MSWIAAAVIGGGALLGGAISAYGATSAADTQASAAENAAQIGYNEFNTITQQEQPFMQGGYSALNELLYGLGLSPQGGQGGMGGGPSGFYGGGNVIDTGFAGGPAGRFNGPLGGLISAGGAPGRATASQGMPTNPGAPGGPGFGSLLTPFTADYMKQYSPAYQFQLQQGMQGVLNSDSSSQGALSGASLKDLINYNQGTANTAFNNAFNQYQAQQGNIYQRLSGLTQLGQAAAANTGQQGTALAGNIAQSITNAGTAQAAGTVGAANAIGGSLSSLPWLMAGNWGNPYGATSAGGPG